MNDKKSSLKGRAIKGTFWSAIDSLSGLAIQMICSLVVARLLTPRDFGIVGMITVFSSIGLVIIDSGFGQALIRKSDASKLDFSSVFYFNLILSVIIYILFYFISPFIESFYGISGLCLISRIVFLIMPLNAIGLIQNTILTKKIDFKTLGIISFISAFISGIIGIVLAYKLRSVWAIVYQTVSMYLFRTILLWIISKWRPSISFSIASIKSMFPFASNLMLTGLLGTIVNNISPLVIGKFYDATQLGFFSQADKLQKVPSSTSTAIIQRVTFPVLVEIQDDNSRLRSAYCRILSQAAYFISPIMIGILVVAPQIINIFLGEKWMPSAYYLQILCISGLLYPLSCLSLNLINVKGNSKLLFYLEILRKTIFVLIIAVSIFHSIDFFVWMQAVYAVIQLFINLYFSGKQIQLKMTKQFEVIIPLIGLSIISCIPVFLINTYIRLPELGLLSLNVVSYFLFYICLSIVFHIPAFQECKLIVKKIINK